MILFYCAQISQHDTMHKEIHGQQERHCYWLFGISDGHIDEHVDDPEEKEGEEKVMSSVWIEVRPPRITRTDCDDLKCT